VLVCLGYTSIGNRVCDKLFPKNGKWFYDNLNKLVTTKNCIKKFVTKMYAPSTNQIFIDKTD